MAYDEALAARIRGLLAGRSDITEKKMFGGLTFLLGGHMCCGVAKDELVLRLGAPRAHDVVGRPFVRFCDFTGTPMKSMVTVAADGFVSEAALADWLQMAVDFAASLPAKA